MDYSWLLFMAGLSTGYFFFKYSNRVGYCRQCDSNYGNESKCPVHGTKLEQSKWCPQRTHGIPKTEKVE